MGVLLQLSSHVLQIFTLCLTRLRHMLYYDLKSKELEKRITSDWVITRELDRVPSTKYSILYTLSYWFVLQYYEEVVR